MPNGDDLLRTILGDHANALRQRRLRSLMDEDTRCLDFIRSNANPLRSKFAPIAADQDFLDLFVELIWACLVIKGEGGVEFVPCRPAEHERTPDLLIRYQEMTFNGECRRIRESTAVEYGPQGRITTMAYTPRTRGEPHDTDASRRISDAILAKLGQLNPHLPNLIILHTNADISVHYTYLSDAISLLQRASDDFITEHG